jgi:hypothetical protein
MVDAPSILSFAATTGVEALSILNKWLDTSEVTESWYGKDEKTQKIFLRPRNPFLRLIRKKYDKPEIGRVFTIMREDWQVVIKESLPVAHDWYRRRKDSGGECSWLPLFWASQKPLGTNRVCPKAESAFTSLGIVSNMPAARLDLWGLVVMAYSNGAWAQIITADDGGFRVTLHAKNFVLDINQENINAPTIAHLEPREHPAEECEPLCVDETRYLLEHGHSFSSTDVSIGWPLNGCPESQPPRGFIDSQLDEQVVKVILDDFKVKKLKIGLHNAILCYLKKWKGFIIDAEHGFTWTDRRDIASELLQVQIRVSQAWKPQMTREDKDIGLDAHEFPSEDIDTPESQPGQLLFPRRAWKRKIRKVSELIDLQLWRIKLLFYDEIKLADTQNQHDALEIFKGQGELLEKFSLHYEENPHLEHSAPAIAASIALEELLRLHHAIMAKARMLHICERVDLRLSTRNTGYNVLLA